MEALYQPFQPVLTESALARLGLSMKYSAPAGALKDIVHSFLQINATRPIPYTVIPDATQAAYISPDSTRVGGAFLRTFEVPILEPGEYFGIWFRPGALSRLFGIDLSEIRNQFVDHKFLPCPEFWRLSQRLYEVRGFRERARICERWLLTRGAPRQRTTVEHALSLIYGRYGDLKISQLERKLGFTGRHLNRLFQRHVGLSTKAFTQIVRIQHACRSLYGNPRGSMDTALDLGFFDQSHLLRECRKYLSAHPTPFFERFRST